jgi:hypothetical protein
MYLLMYRRAYDHLHKYKTPHISHLFKHISNYKYIVTRSDYAFGAFATDGPITTLNLDLMNRTSFQSRRDPFLTRTSFSPYWTGR